LAESIHPTAHEALTSAGVTVHTAPGGLGPEELVAALNDLPPGPIVVGVRSKTKVRKAIMEQVPRLAAIGCFCIGTDQVDLDDARQRGIAVFNAPFSNTRSVAELVIGEIIMLSRQIFPRSMAAHRGTWDKSATGSHEVRGKVLGIIGYGHIGSQLSVLAESLGLRVIFYDITPKLPLGNAEARAQLSELLAQSDFVSLHVPNTEATRGMFGDVEMKAMKAGAYLINASRGNVVDIDALRAHVESGHIGGAAIDVYPAEPAARGDAFETPLRGLDQVILTPHIGGSTQEAQANIGREVGDTLGRYLRAGRTTGCITLPELEPPVLTSGCRLMNHHRNVPGVLSEINKTIAESGLNIVGQRLATNEALGSLLVDFELERDDPRVTSLVEAISGLETSIHTRVL
jgi:D-3-phosphoglycerate dehydrogenase